MEYRRAMEKGGSYFFTVNLADRSTALLVQNVDLLRSTILTVRAAHPFEVTAIVVMPEHLHCIWEMPSDDADFSMRWALIKAGFSRGLPREEQIAASRAGKRERGIWQRRYWEHLIRDETDLRRHIDYIHFNPVKHGHVQHAADWRYSSLHRYMREKRLPMNWGNDVRADGAFG
jgi:putative transposase